MSVAGGLPLSVDRAVIHGCLAFQIFAKNANRWCGRILPPDEVREFRARVKTSGIGTVVSHASYLINLATTNGALRRQSIEAMGDEIDRAEALGLLGVVLHPGCYTHGNEADAPALVANALKQLLSERAGGRTMVLLEQTAGQGTSIGARFEHLAAILAKAKDHGRLGVCLDTCHLFAAGYDVCSPEGYADTFAQFGRLIGFDRLKLFHLNDSKKPFGSRIDRHEHIGQGHLGLEPFRRLVNDPRFRDVPMLLETPKTERRAPHLVAIDPLDERNLTTLRGLIGCPAGRRRPAAQRGLRHVPAGTDRSR
jgi:deoxyribonuclease-4